MDYTTNLNLKKPNGEVDGDFVLIEDLNSNFDAIDTAVGAHTVDADIHVTVEKQAAWDNLKTFQTAGGTATAITLTGVELVDGFQTTFVILASNSGAATTVNGKPLYKPGGTVAPNLVAGKAASIWYNLAGDCFFIKASTEGTAVAGDVLAGKTFSNDDDTGIAGSFTNIASMQSGEVTPWATTVTSYDITISAVNTGRSVVFIYEALDDLEGYINVTAAFLNASTTLRLMRYFGSTLSSAKIYWKVIEFNNIKSIQRGTLNSGLLGYDVAKDITISALTNVNKAFILTNHFIQSLDNKPKDYFLGAKITNQTTISLYGPSTTWGAWQVIEFN